MSAIATATAHDIVRQRERHCATVIAAVREIGSMDHLLGQIAPALTRAEWEGICALLDAQEERIDDANAARLVIDEALSKQLHTEPKTT